MVLAMNTTTKPDEPSDWVTAPRASADLVISPECDAADEQVRDRQKAVQAWEAKEAQRRQDAIHFQVLAEHFRKRYATGKTPEQIEAEVSKNNVCGLFGVLTLLGGNRLRQAREAVGISRRDLSRILSPEIYDRHSPHLETYPGLYTSDLFQKQVFLRLMANGIDALYINLGVRLSAEQLEQAKKAARALIAGKE